MAYSPDVISYGYSGLVLVGGIIGFLKAGSLVSLGSGVLFGTILMYGAYRTSVDWKDFYPLFAVSSILLLVMGFRFYNSGKFMPAGLVAALSLLQVARLGIRFM